MISAIPILADLVFLGCGHAQIAAIKNFAMRPVPGLRLTIVTGDIHTPYSGMLPGFVEGVWQEDDFHIDIAHLAQFAGARLIVDPCTGIDADTKLLFFKHRPPLRFDLLSVVMVALDCVPLKGQSRDPVKPITKFRTLLVAIENWLAKKIAVIGGGAGVWQ